MKQVLRFLSLTVVAFITFALTSCVQAQDVRKISTAAPKAKAVAAFAEGCFWCSVHIFEAVKGVDSAIAGYAGGNTKNPTYQSVSSETTGHAESILVYYNPAIVSYDELLNVFFTSQDPTTPDQQGPDRGSSYRSVIFYQTPTEKVLANNAIDKYSKSGMFKRPIVTEVTSLDAFYRAEEYHQHYIIKNPNNGYVLNVSIPRYNLFKKTYKGKLQ
jgi:peptide-methionine (S)-S-oxide reductase